MQVQVKYVGGDTEKSKQKKGVGGGLGEASRGVNGGGVIFKVSSRTWSKGHCRKNMGINATWTLWSTFRQVGNKQ